MTSLKFRRIDGSFAQADMAKLRSLAEGFSRIYQGWESTLVYCDELNAFIELHEAPADLRGNSEGGAKEVDSVYAESVYGVSTDDLDG